MPVMADRAGQALATLALDPAGAAQFEPNSDGCRPGRACHEAMEAIHASLTQHDKYVLDAAIEKCVDRLCHQARITPLPTFPALRRTIPAWLKAGVMDGADRFPTETGAPPGGGWSPLLRNVARHGLETAITDAFPLHKDGHRGQPRVRRFADDLVVFHRDSQAIVPAQDMAARWLQEMG